MKLSECAIGTPVVYKNDLGISYGHIVGFEISNCNECIPVVKWAVKGTPLGTIRAIHYGNIEKISCHDKGKI